MSAHTLLIILKLTFLLLFSVAAYIDYVSFRVYDRINLVLYVLAFLISRIRGDSVSQVILYSIWFALMLLVINIIYVLIISKSHVNSSDVDSGNSSTTEVDCEAGVGAGDVKIAPALTLFIGNGAVVCLTIGLFFSVVYSKCTHQKYVPYLPFFLISAIMSQILF